VENAVVQVYFLQVGNSGQKLGPPPFCPCELAHVCLLYDVTDVSDASTQFCIRHHFAWARFVSSSCGGSKRPVLARPVWNALDPRFAKLNFRAVKHVHQHRCPSSSVQSKTAKNRDLCNDNQAIKTFAVFTKYGALARKTPQSFGGLRMSATIPDAMFHLVLLNKLKLARARLWRLSASCPSFQYFLPSHVWNSTPS
jgi:hypothetical protein